MSNITRLGTANMYATTIATLSQQQKQLADQAERLSTGKRVVNPSDDPVAAAQAERARTRLSRIETDQRSLESQRATMAYAESSLGEVNDALVEFRALIVNAGNGSYSQVERDALAGQLESLRAQILTYANRKDSNGLPLFRGLDGQETVIQGQYDYAAQPGQQGSSEYGITNSLNGALAFMDISTGNGVLAVSSNPANTGSAWADTGSIRDPAAATAVTTPVNITFDVTAGVTTYSVDGGAAQPYKSGQAISVAGMNLNISGVPADGDMFSVGPSTRTDLFSVMDSVITAVRGTGSLQQGISKGLAEVDAGMNRISTVRGYAGDLLNQADRMESTLLQREEQVEGLRSNAEDIDMVKGLSDLENMKTSVNVALQSYASIQKLSLFNFIN